MQAEKQACKQMQCNKARLLEGFTIQGSNLKPALWVYTLHEDIGGHINTVTVGDYLFDELQPHNVHRRGTDCLYALYVW